MTGANVNVSYEEMRAAGRYLVAGEGEMNTKLTELQNYINNLVTSGFVTESASVSFNESFLQFKTRITEGLTALTQMSTYLENAAVRIQEADESLRVTYA